MYHNNVAKYLYNVNSQYKRANNMIMVIYGYMTPQQMIYEDFKDELIKKILFK